MATDGHDGIGPKDDSAEGGLAQSPRNPLTGGIEPLDGPLDRAGTEEEAVAGETNEPIPLPNDEPEVGLTRPLDDRI